MKRRNRRPAKRPIGRIFERLVGRYCLTVAAAVTDGNLVVTGDADGAVTITAVDATTYKVTDNGADVATLENVTGGIRLGIDASAGKNDQLTIDLGGQSVDRIMANLGNGDNSLTVQGGTVHGNLQVTGGTGNDSLTIAADAKVEKSVMARLSDGDNKVDLDGSVTRDLVVTGNDVDDNVTVGADAPV